MKNTPAKLGRYQILREVGRGAMGVVYKAHDPVIEREVAIKAIELSFSVTPEEKQLYLSRFYREAKAAGKLNHANIVTIYDVDEDKETGVPFIVMEYLEGTTLQEIIAGGILLPIEDVNSIIIQIADALNYAHSHGVVHRDVKSANILILSAMKAKIMDFGIARLPSSDLTQSGQFMGTPNYMSPEQIEGKTPVDGRSDLFSLGIILYLMLTGERPFSGDTFTAVSYKIAHADPLPPRHINPAVPEEYNRIVAKLLAKDPASRYKSGQDLIRDLRNLGKLKTEYDDVEPEPELTPVTSPDRSQPAPHKEPSNPVLQSSMSSQPTMTLFRRENFFRLAIVLLIVAAGIIAAVMYPSKDEPLAPIKQTQIKKNPPPSDAVPQQVAPGENPRIRTKLDMGLNYYHNGFYDKAIEEFNEILIIDPKNAEAKQYLELANQKKTEAKNNPPVKRKKRR